MKISAINGYSFNNVNFEARRKKDIDVPVHKATPVKAIPLALLIAMSPVNAQVPTGPRTAKQVEYSIPDEKEITTQFQIKNATPDGSPGIVTIYDTGNNKKSMEIHLNNKISSYAIDVNDNVVNAYRLKEVDIIPEELYSKIETVSTVGGHSTVKKRFYVVGSGTEYTNPPRAVDETIELMEVSNPIIGTASHQKYEISEDLYKYLKKVLKEQIAINEENASSFIIKGRRQ